MSRSASWIRQVFEFVLVGSRWLVTPFLVGLVIGLAALLFKFAVGLAYFLAQISIYTSADVITGILKLVDLTLTANLIVIVIFSSYENFVTPIDSGEHDKWPPGLARIGFAGLKQKLLGSIVAIAAVNVLEWFMDIDKQADTSKLTWVVAILLSFAITMLVLAIADRVSKGTDTTID
jgi:uncharacterized protein (TIGR00645 family)